MGVLGGEGSPHAAFRITVVLSSGRAAAPGHARGVGLCLVIFSVRWCVICCQDGCVMAFAKGALPKEYLSHNFDEQCLGGH